MPVDVRRKNVYQLIIVIRAEAFHVLKKIKLPKHTFFLFRDNSDM